MKPRFLFIIAGSLLLLGAGCARTAVVVPSSSSDTKQVTEAPVAPPVAPKIEQSSITAENQKAGERVNIASVQLAVPAFVVIHEDAGGKPGAVIAKSELFKAGVYTVTVTLNRPSKAGEKLYAMLHGANDVPLKDGKGIDAMSAFTITK